MILRVFRSHYAATRAAPKLHLVTPKMVFPIKLFLQPATMHAEVAQALGKLHLFVGRLVVPSGLAVLATMGLAQARPNY